MNQRLVTFLAGGIFAAGLSLGGMLQPGRVVGFLDLERWDPSLLLVMCGALAVMVPVQLLLVKRLPAPVLGGSFPAAPSTRVDARLILGSALFGVGWGLSGFCPGPSIVAVAAGNPRAFVFLPAMLAGMLLFQRWNARTLRPPAGRQASSTTAPPRSTSG